MINWSELFAFDTPILEIFVRGTSVYWALFLIMRFLLKRGNGAVGISDLLVVVLLGDAIQNGMAGEYKSISDGLLLVLIIVGWDYILDWAAYHYPALRRFVQPQKICLVKNGRIQWKNMQAELINKEELMAQLRLNDTDSLKDVKSAYLEPNGDISVVTVGESGNNPKNKKRSAA
jgi:uncharacterized membrane protein YcaP (DUF421 family)